MYMYSPGPRRSWHLQLRTSPTSSPSSRLRADFDFGVALKAGSSAWGLLSAGRVMGAKLKFFFERRYLLVLANQKNVT